MQTVRAPHPDPPAHNPDRRGPFKIYANLSPKELRFYKSLFDTVNATKGLTHLADRKIRLFDTDPTPVSVGVHPQYRTCGPVYAS